MNRKEIINGEHLTDGDKRLFDAPQENCPGFCIACYERGLDLNDDSDDLEEIVEVRPPLYSIPYQAAEFLADAKNVQKIVENTNKDMIAKPKIEAPPENLLKAVAFHIKAVEIAEDAQLHVETIMMKRRTGENQQSMEVVAGIENKPEDAELHDQVLVEQQADGKVEDQESVLAENQLDQDPIQHAMKEKVEPAELSNLEEIMEVRVQPDIQILSFVQEHGEDQIVDLIPIVEEVESLAEEIVHQKLNGEPGLDEQSAEGMEVLFDQLIHMAYE